MADRKRKASDPLVKEQASRKITNGETSAARLDRVAAHLRSQTCSICFESKVPADLPASKDLPTACAHNLDICRACITRSITDDIAQKSRDRIGCPQCGTPWDDYFLRLYAEPKAFAVFEALDVLRVLEAMPDFRRCLRPGCDSGQLHEAGDAAPIVSCIECGYKTCFTHRIAWHTDVTCADFDASEEMEEQTRARVTKEENETRNTVRPCPHCNVDIEKDGGCDHMHCECPKYRSSICYTDVVCRHKMPH